MEWLFERMIEAAAWFAFMIGLVFFGGAIWSFVQWVMSGGTDHELLYRSGYAAAGFIVSAIALGALACIDRYVFDMPEEPDAP